MLRTAGHFPTARAFLTDATLQINRKLNDKGRNTTFRGQLLGYGDNDNNQYTESTTRYYQIPTNPDSTLVRNQYITTPTNNYNYERHKFA